MSRAPIVQSKRGIPRRPRVSLGTWAVFPRLRCCARAAAPPGRPFPSRRGPPEPASARSANPEGDSGAVRYLLDGIEIVGNTKTRRRVVEHFIPFHKGDVLDVDDPALELTRYRLLGS